MLQVKQLDPKEQDQSPWHSGPAPEQTPDQQPTFCYRMGTASIFASGFFFFFFC
jgi:hypothetical protein